VSSTCRRTLLAGLVLIFAVALADVPALAAAPTAKEIARWIEQLGDNSFAVREGASKKLWAAGAAAETALEAALKSDDAEVVRRARDILDKFKWGIYPDTPAEIVALVQAYQSTEGNARRDIVQKLLQGGPTGLQTVLKISKAEKDPTQRKILGDVVSSKLPAAFPQVLEDGKYEQFEPLLELGHDSGVINHNQYTAYWLLRSKLDERIAHFRSLLERTPTEKRFAETLAYLYRAKGDLPAALKAAEQSERADLLEGILYEAADWKALAARPDVDAVNTPLEKKAFHAAYARLGGNPKEFEKALAELTEEADKVPPGQDSPFVVTKTLLLNDRPIEGLKLLANSPNQSGYSFEILCARLQYREAIDLAEKLRPAGRKQLGPLDLPLARILYLLGEKDKAQALFGRGAEEIKDGADPLPLYTLLQTEARAGLKDQVFEHCAKILSVSLKNNVGPASGYSGAELFLSQVFTDQNTANVWWMLLRRKFKDEPAATVLKRLRDLMEGKIAAKEVQAWIKEADSQPLDLTSRRLPQETDRQARAMAEVAATAGLDELAYSLLEKANTPQSLLRLGDLLAAKKRWVKASEHYRQAWRKNLASNPPATTGPSADPLPLYLAGDALMKAGQDKEGRRLMEQAHWVLLGDAAGRYSFQDALSKRGHKEAARRESELLRRVSEPNSYYAAASLRLLAAAAAARKDYATAAEGCEQSMLYCLHAGTSYLHAGAYAAVPAQVHQYRARALLAADRFDDAAKQIELALTASPGNVELSIGLVPELERRGRKKEAAALFDRSVGAYEKLCRDYPRCAWAHNSAAWMSACCRRNLDKALEHAKQAVELAPTNAGYLDTLAEVHFQRGEKDKAVALQKRAIELDGKKTYFRKQLRRLEAGDPAAERPAEEEE